MSQKTPALQGKGIFSDKRNSCAAIRRVHDDIDGYHGGLERNPQRTASAAGELRHQGIEMRYGGSGGLQGEPGGKADNAFLQAGKAKIQPFDRERLTEKEKQWLIRIAQKSELARNPVNQRGRKR